MLSIKFNHQTEDCSGQKSFENLVKVVGNGDTWERFEPRTKLKKSKIQKTLNFVF